MNTSAETENKAQRVFEKQKKAYLKRPCLHYEERIDILKKIEVILETNDEKICDAICRDFGNRSHHETKILEITTSILGLRDARKRLKKWMKTQKRHTSLVFFGGKNRVIPQAKGVVGVVVPWNYPLFLAMGPLTSAVAAGNRVMIKQAANSQNLCQLLHKLFSEQFSEELISILPGVPSNDFSSLPFDHLIFTGSPGVGKTIMKTAAESLTPVTLELGGKSPTILADDFDLKTAVERIMFAKLMNSGQTCIAPDYLFVPKGKLDAFIKLAKEITSDRYPGIGTRDFTSLIDEKAYSRLMVTLEDARKKNADIIPLIPGVQSNEETTKIAPVIVTSVNGDMILMQDEIFGPILPIMTYDSPDEIITYINGHERPLALYIFSNDQGLVDRLINNTMSGGVTINDCAIHAAQHDIPFGGVGNSGLGHYHGYEGFLEFSKLRPIFKQAKRALPVTPPYGSTANRIYSLVKKIKWIS